MDWYIILSCLVAVFHSCESTQNEIKGTGELGHLVATMKAPSLISCAQKCKRHKDCYSGIFTKDSQRCHLMTGGQDRKNRFIVTDEKVVLTCFSDSGQLKQFFNYTFPELEFSTSYEITNS